MPRGTLEQSSSDSPEPKRQGLLSSIAEYGKQCRTAVSSLFGIKPAGQQLRKRRTPLPPVQPAEVRIMMSGTTPLVDMDTATWGNPTNGAQAQLQPVAGQNTYDIALNPTNTEFATAVQDGTIRIFSSQTGALIRTLEHGGLITGVEYSPDGAEIASTGYGRTVKFWNAQTGELKRTINISSIGSNLLYSPDGSMIAVGVAEQPLHLLNAQTGAVIRTFPAPGEACRFAFLGNTKIAISGGTVMNIFDVTTGAQVTSFEGLGEVYASASSDDGSLLLAGDNIGQAALWNTQTGQKIWQLGGHGPVRALGFTHSKEYMFVGGYGGRFVIYDIRTIATGGQPVFVQEYQTPQMPQSPIATSTDQKVAVISSHDPTSTRFLLYDLPDPTPSEPEPEPDPEPDPDVNPDPNLTETSELARTLLSVQEELSTPTYVRSFVTAEILPESNNALFKVRFSNPGDATYARVWTISPEMGSRAFTETILHEGGTADSLWQFVLRSDGDNGEGQVRITLYADEARTIVLDEILGQYNRPQNRVSIATEQIAWDVHQAGLMESEPITPSMSIVKITGNNVLLSVDSPYDQSVVTFETSGRLAFQRLTHEGGGQTNLSQITFNAVLPSGEYTLKLYDRNDGHLLDSIVFNWDRNSLTLTPLNAADMLTLEQTEGISTTTFDAMNAFLTSNLDNAHFNWTQQVRFYHITEQLASPLNFFIDAGEGLMNKIFAVYPQYRPENWEAGINAVWDQMGHTFSWGQAADNFHDNRLDLEGEMREDLGTYEEVMGLIMQEAVNVYISIRHGGNEQLLVEQLDSLIAQKRALTRIIELAQINVRIPSTGDVMAAAKAVFDMTWREMLVREEDLRRYREAQENVHQLAVNGWRRNSDGTWEIYDLEAYFKGLMRTEGVTTLIALQERLKGDGAASDVFASLLSGATEQPSVTTSTLLASINSMSDIEVGGHYVQENAPSLQAMRNAMQITNAIGQRTLYNAMSNWYKEGHDSLRSELGIQLNTAMGHIALGASGRLWSAQSEQEKWEIAISLQRVTDIAAWKFIDIYNNSATTTEFASGIRSLLIQGQYGEMLVGASYPAGKLIIAAHPDIPAHVGSYTNGDIRIRFDMFTDGKEIREVNTTLNGTVLARTSGALFIDIPIDAFNQSADGIIVTINAKLSDGTWISKQSDAFNVRPHSLNITLGLSTLPESSENRDEEDVVLSILKQSEHLFYDDLTGWTWSLASTAHDGEALHAIDLIRASAENAPVVVPYAGTVVFNALDTHGNSTLILEHAVNHNGRTIYFYTKYLHMKVNADNQVYMTTANGTQMALLPGMELSAGEMAGHTGSVGQSTGSHLHEETILMANGQRIQQTYAGEKRAEFFTTPAIDQRKILTTGERRVAVAAQAGYMSGNTFVNLGPTGRLEVVWNETAQVWMNMTYNVVYDRREQQDILSGTGSYWLAYQPNVSINQMEKVKWDQATGSWYAIDANDQYITDSFGKKRKWISDSSTFIWQ